MCTVGSRFLHPYERLSGLHACAERTDLICSILYPFYPFSSSLEPPRSGVSSILSRLVLYIEQGLINFFSLCSSMWFSFFIPRLMAGFFILTDIEGVERKKKTQRKKQQLSEACGLKQSYRVNQRKVDYFPIKIP